MYEKIKPSILQIGGLKYIFVIDLVSLGDNAELNQKLKELFQSSECVFSGVGLQSDLVKILQNFPGLTACAKIARFIEAEEVFKRYIPKCKNNPKLALAASEVLFGKRICKKEQMSNWEARPLR